MLELLIVAAVIYFICKRNKKRPRRHIYRYSAETTKRYLDHDYIFSIEKIGNVYRCYVNRYPSFRGRNTANYLYHILRESKTRRVYICWTGAIRTRDQAMTLCENWANATQKFIDTGVPAPGFSR